MVSIFVLERLALWDLDRIARRLGKGTMRESDMHSQLGKGRSFNG